MKGPTDSQDSPNSSGPSRFWPLEALKGKQISYLTLPLIVMATIVEFVILATGWKYQQVVCVPNGMGVTFFGIGPIGATILAVELLKLPLAIWTASREGWQKGFMLCLGLPLICILTFQLVKDMAVYEMGTAMTPASQMLEKAAAEEIKIEHLNGELAAIEKKKKDRELKLAELAAKQAKAKADLDDSLKRHDESRKEASTLTDYQRKELSEVEARQAAIIKQFDADTEQLTKALVELRARREAEVTRASRWNAEEARIENAYKAKLAEYTNKKAAYEKDKVEYEKANFVKRKLMREPVDPGVPPERESNMNLKPTLVADLEAQIAAKETELSAVNNKRRERVAQVDADARRVREDFDRRSSNKREETDRKREESLAALAATAKEAKAEQERVDAELAAAVKKVDGIRAEADAARKRAEGFYEAREAAIKDTQVHRIATTVEIVRGWLFGERPVSITATAKERGDLLTDQISMVRIWVYPVLAFIVAFLPTLMVEIGFSTLFKPEQKRPAYRLGFFGRHLHWLYIRAGRQKILRAERLAREASAHISSLEKELTTTRANAEKALAEKESGIWAAQEAMSAAVAEHEERVKKKEDEWALKCEEMAASLERAVAEKDAVLHSQKTEIERHVQQHESEWSDRLAQLRQHVEDQRTTNEAERAALIQEHHRKLHEVTEDCKNQISRARRQADQAEMASVEGTAKLADELREALQARDAAESQLKHQADAFSLQLSQIKEDAARELEKAGRQERHKLERQQVEFERTIRDREEDFQHQLKQREQELAIAFEARLAEEKTRLEEDARGREAELERDAEAHARERWKQNMQQREEAALLKLKQREQELQVQAEERSNAMQRQAEQELRRRGLELERQFNAQSRDALARHRQEMEKQEAAFQAKLKQREHELTVAAAAREAELQNQLATDARAREEEREREAQMKIRQREQQLQSHFDARHAELQAQREQELHTRHQEWEREAEASLRAAELRWLAESQQKEETFQNKLRQRDQHWQDKLAAVRSEIQAQTELELQRREAKAADERQRAIRDAEASARKDMLEKHHAAQAGAKQREQELQARITTQTEAHQAAERKWKMELDIVRETFEPMLAHVEKERDEARQSTAEVSRQLQDLKKKLIDASSFLTNWRNGNGDAHDGVRGNLTADETPVSAALVTRQG